MKLQLKNTHVSSLLFRELRKDEKVDDGFSYNIGFSDENLKLMTIIFELNLITEEGYFLEIEFNSIFEVDKDLTEEDHQSQFFSVNAPAIAYPFMRAYIANFLLQSGFKTILLPSVNFQALNNQMNKVRD